MLIPSIVAREMFTYRGSTKRLVQSLSARCHTTHPKSQEIKSRKYLTSKFLVLDRKPVLILCLKVKSQFSKVAARMISWSCALKKL